MRAVTHDRYGSWDVLGVEEVPVPTPGPGEVLVRVHAASLNAGDWHLMTGTPLLVRLAMGGLLKPRHRVLGSDVAGRVEAVGADVTRFRAGDRVFGDLSGSGFGAFAEYAKGKEDAFVPIPDGVDFPTAAAVPVAAGAALRGLRDKGRIRSGQKVLIHGASGGVGSFAVQIARSFGAHVTGVCHTRNVEMVRALGADRVLDYTREDFAGAGDEYDLILDTAAHRPLRDYVKALAPGGTYVMVGGRVSNMFRVMLLGSWYTRGTDTRLASLMSAPSAEDMETLRGLLERGAVKPAIQRAFALEGLGEAMRYLVERRGSGKTVIRVHPESG